MKMKTLKFANVQNVNRYLATHGLEPLPAEILEQVKLKQKELGEDAVGYVLQVEDDGIFDPAAAILAVDISEHFGDREVPDATSQFEADPPQATMEMLSGMDAMQKMEYYQSCQRGILQEITHELVHEQAAHLECHSNFADLMHRARIEAWAMARYHAGQQTVIKSGRVLWKDAPKSLYPMMMAVAEAELVQFEKENQE